MLIELGFKREHLFAHIALDAPMGSPFFFYIDYHFIVDGFSILNIVNNE